MGEITRTIREQITERIRNEVLSGSFDPGQALRESDFASRYGVSRGPVRDAFLQLSQEGFLIYEANRGVTVSQPPVAENRDFIVQLRRQVECYVIQRGLEQTNETDRVELQHALDRLHEACQNRDVAEVAKWDMKFHETILKACGGDDFYTIWRWLCSQMMLTYSRLDNYLDIHAEHVKIFDAFAKRQEAQLLAALEANIV